MKDNRKPKLREIWSRENTEYTILESEKDSVIAMTDPSNDLDKAGQFWRSNMETFLKEFKFIK